MAAQTKRLYVRKSDALFADYSNAFYPISQNVFIYLKKYTVAAGDYDAEDTLVIEFDGAQDVKFCDIKETVTTTLALAFTEAAITGTGRQGKKVTTAATNASSLTVEVFAIVSV